MLIEKLRERQRALGWTDEEMAAALGIKRTAWSAVKVGRAEVSLKTARGAAKAFPDLASYVLDEDGAVLVAIARPVLTTGDAVG